MTEEMGLQTFPKTDTYDDDLTLCDRVSHSWETATGNARLLTTKKRVCKMTTILSANYVIRNKMLGLNLLQASKN